MRHSGAEGKDAGVGSGLHKRHGIGIDASDGYYSVFTGKYTSGPANAIELRRMLA